MRDRRSLLFSASHLLLILSIMAAPAPAQQKSAGKSGSPLTERQKWTALREARRLSQKSDAFEKQGKLTEAERMAEEALALEEKVRGPWSLDVAHRLDQVADLYVAHKKDPAAEPLYERARAIRERSLSAHPDLYERDGTNLRVKRNQPAEKAAPVIPATPAPQNP